MATHPEDYRAGDDAEIDDQYREGYEDFSVHHLMLSDQPRMEFYLRAILAAGVEGTIVVDCGAGTGVLSMMALGAGAAHVFAIEAAERIAETITPTVERNAATLIAQRRQNCRRKQRNGKDGGEGEDDDDDEHAAAVTPSVDAAEIDELLSRFHLYTGTAETFPAEQVVSVAATCGAKKVFIVSEWMGFALFHEAMLNSVIVLREKLRASCSSSSNNTLPVFMLPDRAEIFAAPFDKRSHISHGVKPKWNFLGLDFSTVGEIDAAARLSTERNPVVEVIHPASLIHEPVSCAEFDLNALKVDELEEVNFSPVFHFPSDDENIKASALHGFVLWFDVWQSGNRNLALKTGPREEPTHWKQTTVMVTDEGIPRKDFEGDQMKINFTMVREQRSYEIGLEIE